MKKLLIVFIGIIMVGLCFSCNPNGADAVTDGYSTPTIKGTISIPESSSVLPSEVWVKVIDSSDKTVTIQKVNEDRTFVIKNLNAEMRYRILFTSVEPEHANRSISRDTSSGVGGWLNDVVPAVKEGNDVGSVKLKRLGTIKGKALIEGETEHYDIEVYIPGTSYISKTDKGGSFSIYNVPQGTYTLRYVLDDHIPFMMSDVSLLCPDEVVNPETIVSDVTLKSNKGTVQGTAVFGDSNNSTGITIKLESDDKSLSYDSSTSSDGSYIINGVTPGIYRIVASASGYVPQYSRYFEVTAAEITVVEDKLELYGNCGTISGTVSLSNSAIKEGISVLIKDTERSDSFTVLTDSDGSFTKIVKPGTYTLIASYPEYTSRSLTATVVENKTSAVVFSSLTSAFGVVSGFVKLEGSSENTGVIITLTDSSNYENVYSVVSAADGSFRITGIKKTSNYLLSYSRDGYVSNLNNSIDVQVGKVSTASSVTLKSVMSTVAGKIQLDGASTHENITVLLKNETNQYNATTDQKGEYMINGVLPGTYTLMASKDGYVTSSTKEFVVESSSEKEVELLSLSVAVRSVVGSVTLELGSDYAGALVTATNTTDTTLVYSAISNSAGGYTLAGMKPGEYLIVISKNGYVTATLPTVNIVANTLTDVGSVNLAISKGEITGIARLEGCSDHSGIKVSILGTNWTTETAKDGTYSFTVPTGNYSGGIRFEYEDFETTSYTTSIAVMQTTSYSTAYAVPDQTLKCINVPKVTGRVGIKGATKVQFENITISIKELPEFTFTTESDGVYTFEHVPVGTYNFVFTRENTKEVTKMVYVEPSLEINIENLELVPDAVTLYGNISLKGLADYSGITVRVTTEDSVELKTVTNAAGYWYIGNIIASKSHTIYFEKEGWEGQSFDIDADTYEPMSMTDYSSTHSVELQDNVAPEITNMTATVGKSTEGDMREVYLYLYTKEEGSGIKYIQGNTSDSFDSVTEQEYYNPFKLLIPDTLGDTTIYVRVKDAAGNISNTVSTNVVLKNDKTELYQTLSGDKLHLTYANSPYVMTDNILVPEGEILVIDPGVEIQVKGEYYIQVEGTLSAVGTKDKHIKIYGVDEGQDKWIGIKIINDNDSQITYAEITGLTEGIQGYGTIHNSVVTAASCGYALGYYENWYSDNEVYYTGCLTNSNINGKIYASLTNVLNSTISSDVINLSASESIFNNEFSGTLSGSIFGLLIQNTFNGVGTLKFAGYIRNNEVNVNNVEVSNGIVKYTTFNNSSLSIGGGTWIYDVLNNCSFNSYSVKKFSNSNIIGCGKITIKASRSSGATFDMTSNYWGDDKTVELEQKEASEKITFIYHYPDNFNLATVDWSNYSKVAFKECGYQGKKYGTTGSYSGYKVGDVGPAGGIVFYDKGFYSDGWRYLEAATSDLGSFVFGYYRPNLEMCYEVGTSEAIGTGKYNTDDLVEAMDIEGKAYSSSIASETTTSEYAARKCYDYESGGYSDWFLPSLSELGLLNKQKSIVGATSTKYYMSSSEYYSNNLANDYAKLYVLVRDIYNNKWLFISRGDISLVIVRPIRSF